jgi:hypothetical protein
MLSGNFGPEGLFLYFYRGGIHAEVESNLSQRKTKASLFLELQIFKNNAFTDLKYYVRPEGSYG